MSRNQRLLIYASFREVRVLGILKEDPGSSVRRTAAAEVRCSPCPENLP
jgi:hypothetical protein